MKKKLVGVYFKPDILKQAKKECLDKDINFSEFINELVKLNLKNTKEYERRIGK